jgi:hypothetical protein
MLERRILRPLFDFSYRQTARHSSPIVVVIIIRFHAVSWIAYDLTLWTVWGLCVDFFRLIIQRMIGEFLRVPIPIVGFDPGTFRLSSLLVPVAYLSADVPGFGERGLF